MKRTFLTLFITGIFILVNGQTLMNVGEVFDFSIGDKFHIKKNPPGVPPAVDRITVTDKYFSVNSDTVFYVRYFDSYWTQVNWVPAPHLEYHFWSKTDTLWFTNLDSTLLSYDEGFSFNQYIIQNPNTLCNALINGCAYQYGPGFEDDFIKNEYGKGLGKTYSYFYSGQGNEIWFETSMFYYMKNGSECGNPDNTTLDIHENFVDETGIQIYPNPVISDIIIRNETNITCWQCSLYNSVGQLIMAFDFCGKQHKMNFSQLKKGLYFLNVINDNNKQTLKFLKN
jgi:hypothetical protein